MPGELKDKVTRGVAWGIGEKIGTMLLQVGVSLVVLRLLMPDDFGVIAILTAFSAFGAVVVDSGFSQTLIRKADPAQEEYKSVFVFNLLVSLVLYVLLVGLSPVAARYYDMPVLVQVAPVFFLLLPANALCVIQNTIFTRQFRFALLSKVTFAASLVSGFAAILMALAGCGLWSLVAQRVLQMAVRAVLLWWLSDWRPCGRWSGTALRQMAPFSLSLMATDLISALYNKIPQLFIGRLYAADALGYFDQAQKLKDMPVISTMAAVQGVTYPALSKIADDAPKFAESYRQVVMIVSYALFPIMLGMSAIAPDLFAVLLGEKWMPTVPYFAALCFAGAFYSVAMIAYNVLKVKCSGSTIIRLEVAKKAILTVILVVTIPRDVQDIVWGLVLFAFCEMGINVLASVRYTELSLGRFVRTLLPIALTAGVMYGVVRCTALAIPDGGGLRLVAEIAAGAICYVTISALFRLEAFRETMSIVRKQLKK